MSDCGICIVNGKILTVPFSDLYFSAEMFFINLFIFSLGTYSLGTWRCLWTYPSIQMKMSRVPEVILCDPRGRSYMESCGFNWIHMNFEVEVFVGFSNWHNGEVINKPQFFILTVRKQNKTNQSLGSQSFIGSFSGFFRSRHLNSYRSPNLGIFFVVEKKS